jgi:hypothetical protein
MIFAAIRGHARRQVDQIISGIAHRGHHDHQLVTFLLFANDALRNTPDAFRVAHRRAAVLLND